LGEGEGEGEGSEKYMNDASPSQQNVQILGTHPSQKKSTEEKMHTMHGRKHTTVEKVNIGSH